MKPKSRDNILVEPLDDEVVVYDEDSNEAHRLNPTAAFVWRMANGQRSVSDIAAHVPQAFAEADGPESEDLVHLALDALRRANLLHVERDGDGGEVVSRRHMLKLAATLLPVVATITVPRPMYAVTPPAGPAVEVTPTALNPTASSSCSPPTTDAPLTTDHTFTVTNTGTVAVTLNGVSSNNPAITVVGPTFPQTIDPAQEVVVTVSLSCSTIGSQNAFLTLDVQSGTEPVTTPQVVVDGTCAVRAYTLTPRSLDFMGVPVNGSEDLSATLTNTGTETLTVAGFTVTPAPTPFSVVSPMILPINPLVLGTGETADITVRLSCTDLTQTQSGQLNIVAASPSGSVTCEPLELIGECGGQDPVAACDVSPDSIDYGDVGEAVGATADATFQLRNTGTVDLQVTALTSSNAAFTILGPALPVTLAPGATTTVTVRFICPAAGGHTGNVTIAATSALGAVTCGPVEVEGECST